MSIKHIFNLVLFAMLLGFSSCDPDPGPTPNPNPGTGSNVVEVTKNIDNPTTWSKDSIYLIKKYDFYVNNTLTIEAGTIIKFHPTDGPYMVLGGSGTVVAVGAPTAPIIFTSFKDDANGGDTNGDGSGTTPARKDWGDINTNGLNGSRFEYCKFYYGGNSSYSGTLTIESGSKATVKYCTFAHNDGSNGKGWYGVLNASDASANTIIQDNIFYDNIRPLSISTAFDIDQSNVFHNPDDPTEINQYNGIMVNSINEITAAIKWDETEVPFVIDDNDFWINSGGSLTLANNVVIKFRPSSTLLLDIGSSALVNHSNAIFTSYKDDSRLGDTNGDGSATSPGSGDWEGIYDNTVPVGDPGYFTWSNIYYDNH
ncbi:MAG: hypothetical protein GY810_06300 [Aureispira sp.]|nr:hypothetical protein [Aureispira sp.]